MQVEATKEGYRLVTLKPRYRKLEIPTDWKVEELRKLCKLVNGMAFKPKDWKKSGIPIIRIQNLNNETIEFNYYDKPVEEKYYVEDNDILFGWSGNLGTSFGAHIWKRGKAILNQHIFKVIPNDSVIPLFLFYILNSLVKEIELETHGSIGLVHVKKGYLESRLIPLPTKLEQQKIASILSKVDELIQKTDQIIEQTQRLKKGLINKLINKGFKITKPAGKIAQDIPPDNKFVKLNEIVTVNPSYKCQNGIRYPFVEMAAINEISKSIDYYGERVYSSGYAKKERQKLGFSTQFEFAVYGLLQSIKNDEKTSKDITNAIYSKVKEEAGIVGWKDKRSSEKRMSIAIYDILSENKYPEDKTNELTIQIIDLAKRDL